MNYWLNQTSVSVNVEIVDANGLPLTGLVAATFPTVKIASGATADVTSALSDLASVTASFTAWGVKERGEGLYRLDLPDSTFTTSGVKVIRGYASGKILMTLRLPVAVVTAAQLGTLPTSGTVSTYAGGAVTSVTGNVGGNVVGSVASVTAGVTVTTNNDKTGYALTSGERTSIGAAVWATTTRTITGGSISAADVWAHATRSLTEGVDVTSINGEAVDGLDDYTPAPTAAENATATWANGTRVLTAGTNIVLAKGTGITGFNDIAAADVWAAGTRTITGGSVTISGAVTVGSIEAAALTQIGDKVVEVSETKEDLAIAVSDRMERTGGTAYRTEAKVDAVANTVDTIGSAGITVEIDEAAIAVAVANRLADREFQYVGPVNPNTDELTIYKGKAYVGDDAVRWVKTDYTGSVQDGDTIKLRLIRSSAFRRSGASAPADVEIEGVATLASGTLTLTVEIDAADTADIATVAPVDEELTHQVQVIVDDLPPLIDVAASVRRAIGPTA